MSNPAEDTREDLDETVEVDAAEQALSDTEKEALRVAREGLDQPDTSSKPSKGPQRPDYVPEKFWDAEKGEVRVDALAASYAELEKRQSAPEEEEATEEAEGDDEEVEVKNGKISKKAADATEEGEQEENPVTVLIQSAATEFGSDGQFSEETAESLTKAGIPPEVQAIYVAGLSALQAQQEETVHGYVGGNENYGKMAQWAGRTLSAEELDAFNTALDNPALAENAVTGLYARYQKAAPSEGRKLSPQNGATDGGDVFKSQKEMTDAMANPLYKTDAAYQRQVVEKLQRTRVAARSSS